MPHCPQLHGYGGPRLAAVDATPMWMLRGRNVSQCPQMAHTICPSAWALQIGRPVATTTLPRLECDIQALNQRQPPGNLECRPICTCESKHGLAATHCSLLAAHRRSAASQSDHDRTSRQDLGTPVPHTLEVLCVVCTCMMYVWHPNGAAPPPKTATCAQFSCMYSVL